MPTVSLSVSVVGVLGIIREQLNLSVLDSLKLEGLFAGTICYSIESEKPVRVGWKV